MTEAIDRDIALTLNGKPVVLHVDPTAPLVHVLREVAGLTGTKFSCMTGACGVCTIWLNGSPVPSCVLSAEDAEGTEITTIEGLAGPGGGLHPVQAAWVAEQVAQCGYCQPGMIMEAAALLRDTPAPSRAEIVAALDGHLCRCGTYGRIVRAVERAAKEMAI